MRFGRSDEDLLQIWRAGPEGERDAAVDELFARHYERVARWALRLTGDRDAAADLAQDVFLKAHRHLQSYQGTSQFSTWLYTIVRNEWITRATAFSPVVDDVEVLEDAAALDAGPDTLAERSDRAEHLRTFLVTTLDKTERTVFTLHFGEGLSLDAIARLLRLENTSGAKAYIVSAKRKLAKAANRLRASGKTL
jgi:RNA polymerase sigma-70 factor, ECF subfamily